MKEVDVYGIDATFKALQPVALLPDLGEGAMLRWCLCPAEEGWLRPQVRGAHIRPDDAPGFVGWIGSDAHTVAKVALGRLRWHVHALAVHIELPAVINTADAVFLIA